MKRTLFSILALLALILAPAGTAFAQFSGITLPPSGDNQRASVSQWIGLVQVTIDYSSPDVHGPDGEDRAGKIWGQLVPYGLADLGFGDDKPDPWRAGANENTVFTVSHDVKIEGQPLPAGSYGLHMIPSEDEWTLIFSNNSTSWGSFFYDPSEDALRVRVEPHENEYHEWLTYEFVDRQPDRATVELQWEYLAVPWTITVDNMTELYMEKIRNELRSTSGFSWVGYQAAAQYALQTGTNLEEALGWIDRAIDMPFVGQANFSTLSTKAQILEKLGRTEEAEETLDQALRHPSATPLTLHVYGRQLLARGEAGKALKVFQVNAERHPDTWPVHVGLARGYSAVGEYDKALEHARKALGNAPDDGNRQNLENMIRMLEEGKDVN